ncbi:hypothetical protein Vafri_1902 [Volvox africanus]|nr:hypothetical protein Vafri_1902 [Volvox africanus]
MPFDILDENREIDRVQSALHLVVPFCGSSGLLQLRSTCKKWRDIVDALSPEYTLPRGATLSPRQLLASRPLLTTLTLTPTHLQQRPDLQLLEPHLISLTVRSNMRGAFRQRSGQGVVVLMLSRLTPLRRLQHLALGDCIVADRWDNLASLRRLRELDLGHILEVDNRVLTVLPLLTRLQVLTLPGAEGYSPRYNQISAQGFQMCLRHLQSLSSSSSLLPTSRTSLQRAGAFHPSISCGDLPSVDVSTRMLKPLGELAAAASTATATAVGPSRGLTRLELQGLNYRRHGPEALRHSWPCPLTEAAVLEALVEDLPGLQVPASAKWSLYVLSSFTAPFP